MYDARSADALAAALIDLTGCLNSQRQDEVLLREAGVALDRALFPLLVRLAAAGAPLGVARLADQVGRDASTVSRQIAKLESLGLIRRSSARRDMRLREASITRAGARTVVALRAARRRLLGALLETWPESERQVFPRLVQRLADSMKELQREPAPPRAPRGLRDRQG
jgi:DNA-binding MarR family transcriptional regulator